MPASHIKNLYRISFGLLLDLYHLTMAYGFWKSGLSDRPAVFNLFYRKNPFKHPYAISAGLALAVEVLEEFRFSVNDIQYLGGVKGSDGKPLFPESFLNYLQRMPFQLDIDAVPEGTVVFPNEPLVRVSGPLLQAQLIESALLNLINFSTLVATKSARMVKAARGETVLEFGLRRAQGIDGAVTASRAAFLGGCHATSNVLAGRHYHIPVRGTHAHSWVMCFADEITAFREYARALPNNCIFLVDTFDTLEGVRNAIEVAREMRRDGHEMIGIRLDSGDLTQLSIEARRLLDEAGFPDAKIVGSDNLNEYRLEKLKEKGCVINVWGVGTKLVTAYEQPALGGVYKLSAIADSQGCWQPRMKLSEEAFKVSIPGVQQIRRFYNEQGVPVADMIYDIHTGISSSLIGGDGKITIPGTWHSEDLLVPVFRKGALVYQSPDLHALRRRSLEQQEQFDRVDWSEFRLGLEERLHHKKQELILGIE